MRSRQKTWWGYLIVVAVALGLGGIGTLVVGRDYSDLAMQKEPFARLSYVPSFDPLEDVTLGLPPNSGNVIGGQPDKAIRAIEVLPTQVIMLVGGKAVRSIDIPAPNTLADLVRVVGDPAWVSRAGRTVTLNAAVIVQNGSAMIIAAPQTSEVVLSVRRGVFLAASSARLAISGVYVHASDSATPATLSRPEQEDARPFIVAVGATATMTVSNSTFRYLGRDWNSSYGLSWSKGATGSVSNSLFEHNFIGVYSNAAVGLRVSGSTFLDNSLYGIDPHSASKNLVIENNLTARNGRHGIIFSDHVVNGLVRNNVSEHNGLNGIMMDEGSTQNRIEHNTVTGNGSDGIVLASSGDNTVTGNTISGNRVGLSIRGPSSGLKVSGNTLIGNTMAAQGQSLSSSNYAEGNGGQWAGARIRAIWTIDLAVLLALVALTWTSNRRSRRRGRRGVSGAVQGLGAL
ncbi:MAG: right-handed parallel beta-helix repeat-containing protein [Actinomycetota bacterium]|nr:right-handed parallel beta-helix repeat-containing protein [Actinomycetota bacterium]